MPADSPVITTFLPFNVPTNLIQQKEYGRQNQLMLHMHWYKNKTSQDTTSITTFQFYLPHHFYGVTLG